MKLWEAFDKTVNKMFSFTNGKKVVLWGYKDMEGYFVQHLFKRKNKLIEYIVDDNSMNPKIPIYRSIEMSNISPKSYAVLVVGEYDEFITSFLEDLGFVENVNYIYIRKLFYGEAKTGGMKPIKVSYYDYLEYQYGMDIIAQKQDDQMEKANEDCLRYSCGMGYPLMDVLDNFVFDSNDAVFDYGCGKGEALLLFLKSGVGTIGGVEYDKELYNIMFENYSKVNISSANMIHGDAALICEELDQYNYFFMYNPFQGITFENVIRNLENSWKRKPRYMTLIYSGPYCHDTVIEHGLFTLSKQIFTDYSVRNVNIYTIPRNV